MKKILLSALAVAALSTTYAQSGVTPATSLTTTLRQQSTATAGKQTPTQKAATSTAVGTSAAATANSSTVKQVPATNKTKQAAQPVSNTATRKK